MSLAVAKLAGDLGLFELMVKSSTPLSVEEIGEATDAETALLSRTPRKAKALQRINEDRRARIEIPCIYWYDRRDRCGYVHSFESNRSFEPSFDPGGHATQLPDFLSETKYRNPTNPLSTTFHKAYKTDELPFVWILKHPVFLENLNKWMSVQREGAPVWLDKFNFREEYCLGSKPDQPVFVDVGGGLGHQSALFRQYYPDLPGRVILQDQAAMVAQAPDVPGVEKMAHDFWTPQPVKGATTYYLRNVLHDYPDDKCVVILRNISAAMDQHSVVTIDEMVIPEKKAHWRATQIDILMMSAMAAVERTLSQWESLLDAAGLKILKIGEYNKQLQDCVLVAGPKNSFA
ncbi:MAG: hypothetical protein M1820_009078 [Bogoriella megaspora]|nr:MAG: hypothetical protein M1820_009078 [Bogoriella megaspora]